MNRHTARGYTLLLPPGWARIPVRSGTDVAITAIIGRDPTAGVDLRDKLCRAAASAQDSGGLDLYLPTEPAYGPALAASFVVSEVAFGAIEPLNPPLLVAALASSEGAVPVSVHGVVGVRTGSVAPADESRGIPVGSRRVDYVLPVPGDLDRWLSVTFSTLTPADTDPEVTDLLVELFDAIMTTFRWVAPATMPS